MEVGGLVFKGVEEGGREAEIMAGVAEVADLVVEEEEAVDEVEGIDRSSTGTYCNCSRAESCCQLLYLHSLRNGVIILGGNCQQWILLLRERSMRFTSSVKRHCQG